MQTWSGPNTKSTTLPGNKLVAYTLLFFSLAGLIAGFAFGGFLRSNSPTTAGNTGPATKNTPIARATSHITPTPTPEIIVRLGFPQFIPYPTTIEKTTSSTGYSIGMQVIDQEKKPISASDITCKIWLVQQIQTNQILNIDTNTLKNVSGLSSPITGTVNNQPYPEITGGLNLDPATPQLGFCNASGQMNWKYTLSPTLAPGTYDVVILADWKGVHWNWSWVDIEVVQ